MKRHLAFHLLPVKGSCWRVCVDNVLARIGLFDGVRAVAFCTAGEDDIKLDDPGEVRDYLGDGWTSILSMPNHCLFRETVSWMPLWVEVMCREWKPEDVVYYTQGKGVTHKDPKSPVHPWTSLMFHLLLDRTDLVDETLKKFPIAGAFRKGGFGFGKEWGNWHYSGSFFAARAGEFFRRLEAVPDHDIWHGVESWPGSAYKLSEAGCLFHPGTVAATDLYGREYWETTVLPEWRAKVSSERKS